MNRNSLPAIIRQSIETLEDPTVSDQAKFNVSLNLENVVECSTKALNDYKKK